MINNVPIYISLIFGLTTFATLMLFVWAIKNSSDEQIRQKTIHIFGGLLIWLIVQSTLTMYSIYSSDTVSFPPNIMLFGVFPSIITIVLLFATSTGRKFIDSLPIKNLTYLHIVRIPVEIVLFLLFVYKVVPELMTFEGRNFDILAGISAPIVAYFGIKKSKINRKLVLTWNVISLGLLLNIVANAILSTPSPIQKFAFDQPNIAILYFPFSWLPTFIVPIVLFSHLVSIRQLLKNKSENKPNEQL